MSLYTIREMQRDNPQSHPQPSYTYDKAMQKRVVLGGRHYKISELSGFGFLRYLAYTVKSFEPKRWRAEVDEIRKGITTWDDDARWYALNELPYLQRATEVRKTNREAEQRRRQSA